MYQDYFWFLEYGFDWRAGIYTGPYPLPAIGFFTALSFIPWEVGYLGLATLGLFALLVRLKRSAPAWCAYIPILQVMLVGNLDLVWWGLWQTRLPVAYALMTLKPQLLPFALPEIIRWPRRKKLAWLAWTAALWLPCWLVRPGWFGEWIRKLTSFDRITEHWASNLWNAPLWILIGGLAAIPLVWWITKRRPSFRPLMLFLNPGINSYDYAVLAGTAHWIIIPASWLAQIAQRYYGANWAWGLLGLLAALTTLAPRDSTDPWDIRFRSIWERIIPKRRETAPEFSPPAS